MKTSKNVKFVLSVIVFALVVTNAYSYPPDNAAVLYYKAVVLYELDNSMNKMLRDLQSGDIELNEQIREFVKKDNNRRIIDTVLDASEVKNCDWGMDFSQGMEMDIPPYGDMRNLAYLVIVDIKIMTEDGDYQGALNNCLALYRMARHANDRIYISHLVAISINGLTNGCLIEIMAGMPQDEQNLVWLKNKLIEIESIPFSLKPAILGEREAILSFMKEVNMEDLARMFTDNESVKKKILSLDESMIERNREYFKDHYFGVIEAFDMPYAKGYNVLYDLQKKIEIDAETKPEAILTGVLAPAETKVFSLTTRSKTHDNAIRAAVEIYLIKARTGKLPDELPEGLPGDLFSGKDFVYEKTADGFVLRCQGKELSKDEIYEYEFKVK